MKKIYALIIATLLLTQLSMPTFAEGKLVEAKYYKSGKVTTVFSDKPAIPCEVGVSTMSVPSPIGTFSFICASKGEAPKYKSSLQPVNNYSYTWALSECTNTFIDKMLVSCTGYR